MVLGCGPEAKDWASCWWRKSAHLPEQLEDPSRVTGSQSPHPHHRILLGRNFLEGTDRKIPAGVLAGHPLAFPGQRPLRAGEEGPRLSKMV